MRKRFQLLALIGLVCMLSGCAYAKDRGNDLADILHMKLMVGNGAAVSARALWFAVGAGESESYAVGAAYRGIGTFKSHRMDYQFIIPAINIEDEFEPISGSITQYGVGDPGLITGWEKGSPTIEFDKYFQTETYESYLRVGVTAQVIIGVDMELRPVELVDFVLGLFTLDLTGDDTYTKAAQQEKLATSARAKLADGPDA